jgi:hypothetical protein
VEDGEGLGDRGAHRPAEHVCPPEVEQAMKAAAWLAMASVLTGASRLRVRPMPALSKVTTR